MRTKRQLLNLWRERGFRPLKRLGQNFLIEKNVADKLIDHIGAGPEDSVLEVGPGFGALTTGLCVLAKSVTAVEKDPKIAAILRKDILRDVKNVDVEKCDFLKFAVSRKYSKAVGNLPYYITTPIIEKLLDISEKPEIYIMVQREYADRLAAAAGDKNYSSLSCFVQFNAEVSRLGIVKRSCFYPEPKVDSVFLSIKPYRSPKVKVRDPGLMFMIIRSGFGQRRKKLVTSLCGQGVAGMQLTKSMLGNVLEEMGIDRDVRPEVLSLTEFARLSDALRRYCPGRPGDK